MPTNPNPTADPKSTPGRPRALNDAKRREICALVAGGCSLAEAARYVRCALNTIRRELERDPDFQENLRHSQMHAQLSPLRAMQQACATHWRAAAWMLERAYPQRFARRDPAAFDSRRARRLLQEILDIVRGEIVDAIQFERIEKRLRATFEYTIRTACDIRRDRSDLRRAMEYFARKDRLNDPFAPFGGATPDLASLFNPQPQPNTNPARPNRPAPPGPPDSPQSPVPPAAYKTDVSERCATSPCSAGVAPELAAVLSEILSQAPDHTSPERPPASPSAEFCPNPSAAAPNIH